MQLDGSSFFLGGFLWSQQIKDPVDETTGLLPSKTHGTYAAIHPHLRANKHWHWTRWTCWTVSARSIFFDTMYYDPAEQRASEFQVLFLAGGHEGHSPKPELFALSSLYFCDSCSKVLCRKDLAEDVDSYYCPHCLENMPSSEAMLCGMRCSKCWECPVCSSTLTPCIANPSSKEPTYHFACSYCRWSSKGKQEADKPESRWRFWVIFRILIYIFHSWIIHIFIECQMKHWSSIFWNCKKRGVSRNSPLKQPLFCSIFFWDQTLQDENKVSTAAAKEQLITEIVSLERESQPRQRMMAMLEAFRLWDANYVDVFFFFLAHVCWRFSFCCGGHIL